MKPIFFFLCLLVLSSCVVNKPDASRVSTPDYNKRVTVYGAHYKKRPSALGISFVIGGTAAGGYLGYQSDWISYQDGGELKPLRPANAFLGALAGYTLTSLCNYALGQNKAVQASDPNQWVKKANKNYLLLSGSGGELNLMHSSVEQRYTVRNIQDVRDFRYCFPNSPFAESVARQGAQTLGRSDLPELIALYPSSSSVQDMKSRYLSLSTDLDDFIEARNKYPELNADAERKAAGHVGTLGELRAFKQNFPNSPQANEVVSKLYLSLSRSDLPAVADMYPSLPLTPAIKSRYLALSTNVAGCIEAKDRYPELKAEAEKKAAGLASSLTDLKSFKNAFPNSSYANDMIARVYPRLSRSELPAVVDMYPGLTIAENVKRAYLEKSATYQDFFEANDRYPRLGKESELFYEKFIYGGKETVMYLNYTEIDLGSESIPSDESAFFEKVTTKKEGIEITKDKIWGEPAKTRLYTVSELSVIKDDLFAGRSGATKVNKYDREFFIIFFDVELDNGLFRRKFIFSPEVGAIVTIGDGFLEGSKSLGGYIHILKR